MKRKAVLPLLALLLSAVGRLSAEEPPRQSIPSFTYLSHQTDNAALSMDCDGAPPYDTITCHFTQVTVHKSPEDKSGREAIRKLAAEPWEKVKAERDGLCQPIPPEALPATGPAKVAAFHAFLKDREALCECTDAPCVAREFERFLDLDQRTCHVRTNTFSADLRRVGRERKWISGTEPSGMCSAVNVTVIEIDPSDKAGFYKWTFTQTRVSADTSTDFCKDLEVNVPAIFSWKAPERSLMDCRLIEFGS
jgi:hypothetical protein